MSNPIATNLSGTSNNLSRRGLIKSAGLAGLTLAFVQPYASANEAVTVLNNSLVFEKGSPNFLQLSQDTSFTVNNLYEESIFTGRSSSKKISIEEITSGKPGFYALVLPAGSRVPFIYVENSSLFRQNPFFGICVNFTNTSVMSKTHFPEKLLPDLRKIGVSAVRDTFIWEDVEKVKGQYTSNKFYEDRERLLKENRLLQLYCASSTHKDYTTWRNLDSPTGRKAYAENIVRVLKNNPHLTQVEIYNEFNGGFNQGDRSGKNYASLLKDVYPIIKKALPKIEVIAGATSGTAIAFSEEFFKNKGGDYCDSWSFHPYSVSGRGILDTANKYSELMKAYNTGGKIKPLHITEAGWTIVRPENRTGNNAKVFTELDQAINLSNVYAGAYMSSGEASRGVLTPGDIRSIYWYNALTTRIQETREGLGNQATEGSFGLFELPYPVAPNAYSPRIGAWAYYSTRKLLEDFSQDRTNLVNKRKDEQYRYPVIASMTSGENKRSAAGKMLINTSGWMSEDFNKAPFEKVFSLENFGYEASFYWKAHYPVSKPKYGHTLKNIPTTRETALIELSLRPFNEGENYSIHGAIGDYYRSRGGEKVFGKSITAQDLIAPGVYRQKFSKGYTMYWSMTSRAAEMRDSSPVYREYLRTLEEGTWLPLAKEVANPDGSFSQGFMNITTGAKRTITAK